MDGVPIHGTAVIILQFCSIPHCMLVAPHKQRILVVKNSSCSPIELSAIVVYLSLKQEIKSEMSLRLQMRRRYNDLVKLRKDN